LTINSFIFKKSDSNRRLKLVKITYFCSPRDNAVWSSAPHGEKRAGRGNDVVYILGWPPIILGGFLALCISPV